MTDGARDSEVGTRAGYNVGIVQAALHSLAPDQLQLEPRRRSMDRVGRGPIG